MFKTKIDVRYNDTDMMGIVHHSVHIQYAEMIRSQFLLECFPYHELENDGFMMPVRNVESTYLSPIRYGDNVIGTVEAMDFKGVRFKVTCNIYANDNLASTIAVTLVTVNKETFTPVNIVKKHPEFYNSVVNYWNQHKS